MLNCNTMHLEHTDGSVFFLETNGPSESDTISRLNVTLARGCSTCAPARCIWEAQPTGGDICRFSGQGWARSRRWRCRSFAGGGDRPQRSAGTCHPSSVCSAPYRHPDGCYSILNRSKNHLAVEVKKWKYAWWERKTSLNKTCCVQKRLSGC